MGYYIRKSKKVGPFRLNLSKSGIGASVGVRGFRVGTGPRGNYVHAGRNGLYYRKQWGGNRRPTEQSSALGFILGFGIVQLMFSPIGIVLGLIGLWILITSWKALLVWALIIVGIAFAVRRYKTIMQRNREHAELERGRQNELIARADAQHELAKQGNPAGTYGYYPPATDGVTNATVPDLTDAETAFAEESCGTTFDMFAEDPTPRGVWVIVRAIMDVGGFTECQANSILDYQFAQHCPAGVVALTQARQALADPEHHQLDHPLANIRRFYPPTTR
jgi:Protein of unknown function (DUF4236)